MVHHLIAILVLHDFYSICRFTCWLTFMFLRYSTSSFYKLAIAIQHVLFSLREGSSLCHLSLVPPFVQVLVSALAPPLVSFQVRTPLDSLQVRVSFVSADIWQGFFYWGGYSSGPLCRHPSTFFFTIFISHATNSPLPGLLSVHLWLCTQHVPPFRPHRSIHSSFWPDTSL